MAATADLTITLPGYHLVEQIYSGSRTVVYRGVQEQGEPRPVVIKLLRQEYPTFNDLLQFRNQYAIAKNLNIAGVVRPYSLESYRNSYALIMADFGGVSLRDYTCNRGLAIAEVLAIALQLVQILHDLHQNRVIHKNIKPANILINPETKQVKLIDFSIASLLPKETDIPSLMDDYIDMFDEMAKKHSFAELEAYRQQISIRTELVEDRVKIDIQDNGDGIIEVVKTKNFDYLFTTKDVGKGTGLGLAIARQIVVEKHRGKLEVDSTLGKGTTFTILLPTISYDQNME
jgi:serine/threonine protein kinase